MENPIPEIPIKTIEQARNYFIYMGCSRFHMGREYPHRYAEYEQLNISAQTENEWRKDEFYTVCSRIMQNPGRDPMWKLHSDLYNLFDYLRTEDELKKLLEITRFIQDKVPAKDRLIIAETINGRARREDRSGLIYAAYDSGNIAAAKEFAELSQAFSTIEGGSKWNFFDKNKQRAQRSNQNCKEIMHELGLA